MNHHASRAFWNLYDSLSPEMQALADKSFALLKSNPNHNSLRFKKIGRLWSVRVGLHYRSLGTDVEGGVLWFWIGTHAEYDRVVRG